MVKKVNDIPLLGKPLDVWESSLLPPVPGLNSSTQEKESGFCIPHNLLFSRWTIIICTIIRNRKPVTVTGSQFTNTLLSCCKLDKPSDCCLFTPKEPFGHSSDPSISCFTPYDPSGIESMSREDGGERVLAQNGQCLPSIDVLGDPAPVRCTSNAPSCPGESACYRPFSAYRTGSMVRIYYQVPSWETLDSNGIGKGASSTPRDQVVLYQGDPKDIWETVEVTSMAARLSFLPLWLPEAALHTIQYTMSFSLALSILNIVPARHLDGHHTIKAFAALVFSIIQSYKSTQSLVESFSECVLDNGSVLTAASSGLATTTFPKGSKAVKGIVVSTTVLLGGVMVGSLLQMVVVTFFRK